MTEEEIRRAAALMMVDPGDCAESAERVGRMLGYFAALDGAGAGGGGLRAVSSAPLSALRPDEAAPGAPAGLRTGAGGHVRAPRP